MTASCRSRKTSARRPESSFCSWSFVGIFLKVLVFLLPTSTDACGAPTRYESMMLKDSSKETYSPGDRVEYQCRPGYIRIVPPLSTSAVCQANNTWESLQEACRRKPCPQLSDPINGQVNGTFQFGSQAHYTCNEGYYLVGEATLYCELSGNSVGWNADPPHCERILCQPPEQIENGVTNSHKETYEYNEVVIYSCNPSSGPDKYSLIGESKLICSGHNKWSSSPPVCKVVKCGSPIPERGVLLSGHKTQFYYQDTVQIGCQKGFDLQGSKTVVCGADGSWEPELPRCTEVPTPPSTTPPVSTASGPVTSTKPSGTSHPGPVTSTKPSGTSHPGPVTSTKPSGTSHPGPVTSTKPSGTSHPGTTTPTPTSPPDGSLGGGVIAAIVISVLAAAAVIGGYLLYRHKKKGKTDVNAEYRPYQDKSSTPAEH